MTVGRFVAGFLGLRLLLFGLWLLLPFFPSLRLLFLFFLWGGTVAFADGRTVTADGSTPILEAAENAGVLMPSGCRMGICYGCVLPMTEGSVRDLRNGEITTAVPGESGAIKVA